MEHYVFNRSSLLRALRVELSYAEDALIFGDSARREYAEHLFWYHAHKYAGRF